MFSKYLSTIAIFWVLLLASCASNTPRADVDRHNGAKRAWVVEIYTSDMPSVDMPECLATLPKADFAKRHFAKIYYRHSRRILSAIAELPDTLNVKVDDLVEAWPEDCSSGKFSHISRVISPAL